MNQKRGLPGKDPKARVGKKTEYGLQLREKQRIKRMYNMLEKQFHLFFERALRLSGVTGENLIMLLESRLDNVVYRMRFASSRAQARQLVLHGHILVNGRRVNIPSYQVKPGNEVSVKEGSKKLVVILDSLSDVSKSGVVPWIETDIDAQKGTYLTNPKRAEVADLTDIKEQLVVELYSK